MWQKQIPSIQTLAAFIVIVVTGHLLCSNTFSSFAFAASTGDENYCAAHDPREECINPNARFDSDDADDGQECFDVESACKYWSRNGECERNPDYMLKYCKLSCHECDSDNEINKYGVPQSIPVQRAEEVQNVISETISYMNQLSTDEIHKDFFHECKNKDSQCSQWALDDGCDDNPKYMKDSCAPACKSCDYLLALKQKCSLAPDSSLDAIRPGEMTQLFEEMIHAAYRMGLEPTVWSRPAKNNSISPSCEKDITNPCNSRDGPWVITLENFLSNEEVKHLLDWGKRMRYKRSEAGDEVTSVRTSAHAWCIDECYQDPTVASVTQRIAYVTGIPHANYEAFQLLKYEVGQFYLPHDDRIDYHNEQAHGPRLLTFFIYFNEVEKGGGTRFPALDLLIYPKKGRVLVWPSITDDGTWNVESRTTHEAMPVEEGQKFAANTWIHMRDFQKPFSMGCPG